MLHDSHVSKKISLKDACKSCPAGYFCPDRGTIEPTKCRNSLISSLGSTKCTSELFWESRDIFQVVHLATFALLVLTLVCVHLGVIVLMVRTAPVLLELITRDSEKNCNYCKI